MQKISFQIDREFTGEESAAFNVVKKLQDAGFQTFWAGGAVRDMLLGHEAHDIDIATAALPEEIKKLFPQAKDRGKAFGVEAVKINEFEFEIATFRQDIGIADHRRPAMVKFTTAKIDAERRDFTINGLFYDPIKKEIIDYVEGLTDLKRCIVRFIGDPQKRIAEDYLRMLRAVRFTTKLLFQVEHNSAMAIKQNASKINEISTERIREELSKMLLLDNRAQSIILLDDFGLLGELLPEIRQLKNVPQPKEFHAEGDCFTHVLLALQNIGRTNWEELVWAVLLHDSAKPETIGYRPAVKNKTTITFFDHDVKSAEKADRILERLRFSHHFINNVTWAIRQHMRIVHAFTGMSERKQKKLFCDPNFPLLLELTRADLSASLRPNHEPDMTMYNDAVILREKFEKEASEEEKRQVKKFDLINGRDVTKVLGIEPGPKVGKIKAEVEKAYLDGKIDTREQALKMLENYKS